ncbi:MAG: CPBP family intramembrane metalloprotease [Ruminococcus sp.]|nr:CPBP family intramembrane metalloprotease [Ruminococcus sp.]
MDENMTPEQFQTQIAALNHEIYELHKQLEQKEQQIQTSTMIDKKNPFDNPTEYPDYNGDYTDIVPQIEIPGCKIPVEPHKGEKKRLRRFYSIGGSSIIFHFLFTMLFSMIAIGVAMFVLQLKNPDVPYETLYNYAYSSSIIISITAVTYLIANVLFTFIGLKWSKQGGSSLMKTRDFTVGKAVQYCFSAIFIQYGAAIFSTIFSDILSKYGYSTMIDNSGLAETFPATIILIIYQCIIAPVTEELFYRGMVLKTFSKANQRFAIVASSVFFGLAHGNLPQFMLAFLLGMFLAHISIKHNSLLPSIIVHMFVNTTATVINFAITEFEDSYLIIGAVNIVYLLMAVAGLVLFIEFSLKNKLPRTTPQQSRRGFAVAKTSLPMIIAFVLLAGNTILTIMMS